MSVISADIEDKPLQILIIGNIELSWVSDCLVLEIEVAQFMPLYRFSMTDLTPNMESKTS